MKIRTAGLLAAAMAFGISITGCNHDLAQKEAGRYTMQSYQDGVLRSQSQGKGLNGRFLGEMRRSFAKENIKLTHERFAEDGRGNVTYQYLVNGKPSQSITLHVFSSEYERMNRIPHWYGPDRVTETSTVRTEIYNNRNASMVYTSMGKEKGGYSPQINALCTRLLESLNKPQAEIIPGNTGKLD